MKRRRGEGDAFEAALFGTVGAEAVLKPIAVEVGRRRALVGRWQRGWLVRGPPSESKVTHERPRCEAPNEVLMTHSFTDTIMIGSAARGANMT